MWCTQLPPSSRSHHCQQQPASRSRRCRPASIPACEIEPLRNRARPTRPDRLSHHGGRLGHERFKLVAQARQPDHLAAASGAARQMGFKLRLRGHIERAFEIGARGVSIESHARRDWGAALFQMMLEMTPEVRVEFINRIVSFECHCCFAVFLEVQDCSRAPRQAACANLISHCLNVLTARACAPGCQCIVRMRSDLKFQISHLKFKACAQSACRSLRPTTCAHPLRNAPPGPSIRPLRRAAARSCAAKSLRSSF